MPESIVITVYLSKGGVAKTTLTALLGEYLAGLGFTTVIIDFDRQGSQSALFDLIDETGRSGEQLHRILKREINICDALTPIGHEMIPHFDGRTPGRLLVAEGGPQTKVAIDEITSRPVDFGLLSNLDILTGPVQDLDGFADVILIDMGPSDQRQALAGLMATDWLIIPTTMDYLSVQRIDPVLKEVAMTRRQNPGLNVLGIVPTMTVSYFGGLRPSKHYAIGREYLVNNYDELLLKDRAGMVDLPNRDEWRDVMWAAQPLLSDQVSKKCRDEAIRFLNAVGSKLDFPEVKHVSGG